MRSEKATIVIGKEYDAEMWSTLRSVLNDLGGRIVGKDWGVGGSQEIKSFDIKLPHDHVRVEAETYIGISISGKQTTVKKINEMITMRTGKSRKGQTFDICVEEDSLTNPPRGAADSGGSEN